MSSPATQTSSYTQERCGAAASLTVAGVRVFESYPFNRFEDDIRLMSEAQQSAIYGRPLRHDNILIRYFDVGGSEMEFRNNSAKWPRKWQRIRLHPENQGAMPKYLSQSKSGVRPFLSAVLACDFPEVIDTLYLTEGELKAAYGCINGVPCVGIGGITSMCDTQRDEEGKIVHQSFQSDLRDFITGSRVRHLCMVYDADALSGNALKAGRASSFIASVRMFMRSAEEVGVRVTFAVIAHPTAKGLDDLYIEEAGAEQHVTDQLTKGGKELFQHFEDGEELIQLIDESSCVWWRASSRYGLQINEARLRSFLELEGFRLWSDNIDSFEVVRVVGRVIHKSSPVMVMQHVAKFVKELEGEIARATTKKGDTISYYAGDLDEAVTKRAATLFAESKLNLLPIFDGHILTDTATQSFHFFRDKFAEVTSENVMVNEYEDMAVFRGYIWNDWIIPHNLGNFNPEHRCDFDEFLQCICTVSGKVDLLRYKAACTTFGYLMHTYQHGKRYGVVLTDANSSEFEDNGRTGKSEIFCRALTYIRKGTFVQAKRAKFDSQFLWQSVTKTDQVVVVNDLPKGMGIDTFYNEAADAVTVEKKNKDSFSTKVKLVLSTNSLPRGSGESVNDRFIFFAFQNFFSAKHSPADHFGRWLFADWSEEDWSRFFYTCLICQQEYFEEMAKDKDRGKDEPKTYGIVRVNEESTAMKQFVANTRLEFYEWLVADDLGERVIEVGEEYEMGDLLRKFQEEYQLDRVTSRTFYGWIRHYCRFIGYDYEDDTQVRTRKSGAKRYFKLVPKVI